MAVRRAPCVLSSAALLLLSACGTAARNGEGVPAWSLSEAPQLVLGSDGSAETRLSNVVGIVPLAGGELAVVDRSETPVRVFGEGGEFRRVIGRRGQGPEEFGVPGWATRLGDTLLVYDIGRRRAAWLRTDGVLLAVAEPKAEGHEGTVTPAGRLPDGRWLVSAGVPAPRVTLPGGVFRDTLYFGTLPAEGAGPFRIVHRSLTPAAVQIPGGTRFVTGYYFALPVAVSLGGRIVVADPEPGTLVAYAADGSEVSRAALPMPRQRTSLAELERQRDAAVAGAEERVREAMAARFTPAAMPEEIPAFRQVVADGDDALWLEEWSHDPAAPARYQVVGVDGGWRATVAMPPGFTPLAVGPDWVLGVHRNPEGVERVVRYGLTRAAATPSETTTTARLAERT